MWIGDMHPEMLALTTLYGKTKALENSLDYMRKITPKGHWMNGSYSTYSMWWIITVVDYLKYVSADEFARKQVEYMHGLIDLMLEYVSEDGETHYPCNFVDWQTVDKADELQGVRALNIIAVKKAIMFFKRFDEKTENAEVLLKRLMKKEIIVENCKSVLGLKYFAVGLTESDKQKLISNGVNGISTFMSYYIFKAIASFDKERAIGMMKEYYGAMLDKGATTFWEEFEITWAENSCNIDEFPKAGEKDIHGDYGADCYKGFRRSLCHGWSAGIIKFIKEYC